MIDEKIIDWLNQKAKTNEDMFIVGMIVGTISTQNQILEQLKEYQDKIENGTLIELPCKVGDIVYYVNKYKKTIEEYEVLGFTLTRNYTVLVEIGIEMFLYKNEIILTKAEAEKKLAELKGE